MMPAEKLKKLADRLESALVIEEHYGKGIKMSLSYDDVEAAVKELRAYAACQAS